MTSMSFARLSCLERGRNACGPDLARVSTDFTSRRSLVVFILGFADSRNSDEEFEQSMQTHATSYIQKGGEGMFVDQSRMSQETREDSCGSKVCGLLHVGHDRSERRNLEIQAVMASAVMPFSRIL